MHRVPVPERADWRARAVETGFDFHAFGDEPYWDESAYYAFTLEEIEQDIEEPSREIHELCLSFVERAVADEAILRSLAIPRHAWDVIRTSWFRRDPSLYGRLDFSYGGAGTGPAKLLEYNADTPTALFESAVFQWLWLEDLLARGRLPSGTDQFNALHEKLIARLSEVATTGSLSFAAFHDAPEDRGTVAYLHDCAVQAGLDARFVPIEAIGLGADDHFLDDEGHAIACLFKLYPWEWMFRDSFGVKLDATRTRFLEPPWKAVLSNKGLMAHLWAMEPNHPNLLPTFFEDDPGKSVLGKSFVKKPLYSREGANILLVRDGALIERHDGPYGEEGFVRQTLAELPCFGEHRALIGSWIVGAEPAGLCVRESEHMITTNQSRFLPHVISV